MAKKLFNNQSKSVKLATRKPRTIGDYKRLIAKENRKINLINLISFIACVAICYIITFRVDELTYEITNDSVTLLILFGAIMLVCIFYLFVHIIFIEPTFIDVHTNRIKNYKLKIDDIKFAAMEKDKELDQWYKNYRFWKGYESIIADFDNASEQNKSN